MIYNRQKTAALDAVFRRCSHIPFGTPLPPLLRTSLTLVTASHHPRYFCRNSPSSLLLLPPGPPGTPSLDPPTLLGLPCSSFVRFVYGRAKTGSLRIMAVSRILFLERTPSFLLAQTLYRVRSLPSACPSHRHYYGGPRFPFFKLASSFADNNPVAPPPHLATQ